MSSPGQPVVVHFHLHVFVFFIFSINLLGQGDSRECDESESVSIILLLKLHLRPFQKPSCASSGLSLHACTYIIFNSSRSIERINSSLFHACGNYSFWQRFNIILAFFSFHFASNKRATTLEGWIMAAQRLSFKYVHYISITRTIIIYDLMMFMPTTVILCVCSLANDSEWRK
jgi:hypothetical protein